MSFDSQQADPIGVLDWTVFDSGVDKANREETLLQPCFSIYSSGIAMGGNKIDRCLPYTQAIINR